MSTAFKLTVTLQLELLYALLTRAWMPFHFHGIELELLISACRGLMALLVWFWFRDFITSRTMALQSRQRLLVTLAAATLFIEPLLCGRYALPGLALQSTWAATSVIVGIHEELVWRGLLQNLLLRPFGGFAAIVLSNLCFVLFHFGAQPLDAVNAISIFVTGCTLGVIYHRTGSLVAVIAIHAILDAIFSFSPFLNWPWPRVLMDYFDLLALLLALSLYSSRPATRPSKVPQLVRVADDI